MSKIRLMMTADTIGGVWSYALELIQSLSPDCYEILLATLGKPLSRGQCQSVRHLPHLTICEGNYQLEWMGDPWDDVDASGEWLLDLARGFEPDLVHLNTYSHGALPWGIPVIVVGHSCVYSWWHAVKQEAPPQQWQTYYQRVRAGLQHADAVIAPTRAMLDALTKQYGPFANSRIIYNGCDPNGYAPAAKDAMILSVGRLWDDAKNIAILEEVAPNLQWPVFVAGEQQHPAGTRRQFNHLLPLGHLEHDEVKQWCARASIYVLPARYEPFGLSILEAALSGCALVLGDIPTLREVWGDAAVYVPPDDPLAITAALGNLIFLDRERKLLAQKARTRATQYTSQKMANAYHHLYQQLAHQQLAQPEGALQRIV